MTDGNGMVIAEDPLNITIIGDGTAGIMHMIVTYTENRFPQHYCPTVVDSPICNILIDSTMIRLKLWPAPGLCSPFVQFHFSLEVHSTFFCFLILFHRSTGL